MVGTPTAPQTKVRIFVDFWNFTLSTGGVEPKFPIDWEKLGPLLTKKAAELVDPNAPYVYEAMHVYGSYDPSKSADGKLKNWFVNKLDKITGVHVVLLQRQRKRNHIKCPTCHAEIAQCPTCKADARGTEEKGIDTRIATDMVSLAWANSYNVAVLLSADRDFVPVAEFLQTKGIKVIHGSFPKNGNQLAQKCWGSIKIPDLMNEFRR